MWKIHHDKNKTKIEISSLWLLYGIELKALSSHWHVEVSPYGGREGRRGPLGPCLIWLESSRLLLWHLAWKVPTWKGVLICTVYSVFRPFELCEGFFTLIWRLIKVNSILLNCSRNLGKNGFFLKELSRFWIKLCSNKVINSMKQHCKIVFLEFLWMTLFYIYGQTMKKIFFFN